MLNLKQTLYINYFIFIGSQANFHLGIHQYLWTSMKKSTPIWKSETIITGRNIICIEHKLNQRYISTSKNWQLSNEGKVWHHFWFSCIILGRNESTRYLCDFYFTETEQNSKMLSWSHIGLFLNYFLYCSKNEIWQEKVDALANI